MREKRKRRKRKKNRRKRNNPRRRKTKRRRNKRKKKRKSQLKRRKSTLLIFSRNLHSTLMIGRESSATPLTNTLLLRSYGPNSIMKDGLYGKLPTLNTKEKVLLVI